MKSIANNDFSQKSVFLDFGLDVSRFFEALGAVCLSFVALKTGLKVVGLLVMLRILNRAGVEGK